MFLPLLVVCPVSLPSEDAAAFRWLVPPSEIAAFLLQSMAPSEMAAFLLQFMAPSEMAADWIQFGAPSELAEAVWGALLGPDALLIVTMAALVSGYDWGFHDFVNTFYWLSYSR